MFVCILLYHSLNNNQLLPVMFALNISRNRPSCQTTCISNAFWASVSAIKMDLLFSIASVNSSVTISAAMVGLSPLVNPFCKTLCVLQIYWVFLHRKYQFPDRIGNCNFPVRIWVISWFPTFYINRAGNPTFQYWRNMFILEYKIY